MNRNILILDGGTGEELCARGAIDERKLWSASVLKHASKRLETLQSVHMNFITAGATNITTCNYAVVPGVGFSMEEIQCLTSLAGKVARDTIDAYRCATRIIQVGGCLPPLIESYRPDLVCESKVGIPVYKTILQSLAPYVDYWHGETLSSVKEAKMVVEAIGESDASIKVLPLWISFTLKQDGRLRSGETVDYAVQTIKQVAATNGVNFSVLLFNCCEPESISKALDESNRDAELVWGAYPNFLTPVPEGWTMEGTEEYQPMRDDLPIPKFIQEFVSPWLEKGVSVIGGCCGATPEHIAAIRKEVEERGWMIT